MRRPNSNGNGNSMMRPPYGSRGSSPRNGRPRSRDYDDDGGYSDYHDQPSRRSRAEYRDGPPTRGGGRSRAGDSYEMETSRAPRRQRRGFGEMVGEMSRQLSAMVRGTGRAMQREAAQIAAAGSRRSAPLTPSPEMLAQMQGDLPRYRRSRIRMRARKWRLGRVRANPVGYAIGVATVVIAAVSILGGGGAGAVYAYNYYDIHRPAIQSIINNAVSGQNTVIYDRNGQILYNVRSDSGYNYYVPLSQIGQTIQDATIDTEDHSFYSPTNIGVDFQGTLRALLADATHGGAADQGGSTITQQLVKRLILHDPSKQVQRKLNEMILAVGLNANYSKSQILEMYLNTIDYGDQNQGIEAAARNFFGLKQKQENGKVVLANQQLSIAQAAILAGLPNNPTYYLPIAFSCDKAPCDTSQWAKPCTNDPTQGVCDPSADYVNNWGQLGHEWIVWRRARVVLQSMNNYGTITDSQYLDALNQVKDILVNQEIKHWAGLTDGSAADTTKLAPSFVDEVLNELVNQFGFNADTLPTAGLRVYTTLDYKLEQYVEQNIDYYINKDHSTPGASYKRNECGHDCAYPLAKTANAHDAAAVVIDPYTGDVLAMMGTAKYNDKNPLVAGNVNVATAPRSLGSSMKGIVYATAFQMGWTPSVMMQDTPICMPGTGGSSQDYGGTPGCRNQPVYVPHNYTGDGYNGYVPVRLALANSLNIPAVEAMSFVGDTPELANNFITMARRLGITGDVKDANGNVTTYGMEQSRVGPTTALGTQSVPLIQLTNAYAAMADSGKHVPYRTILRIVDSAGESWNAPTPKPAQVISPQAAYMLTSVLSDNAARIAGFNFNNPLEFPDFPSFQIASKTGTGSGKVGPSDIVTIGYSPYLAVGVWVGNANGADMTPGIIGIA
ncbi:MAG TPA: transglycosylase domain-containing protein, partial [Ktedonobacterales bacterium]|nr:transglycosylase domain-containing protein [Ktedonobacterales bacterium]